MASSEMRDNDSERATDTAATPDVEAKASELLGTGSEEDRSARRFASSRVIGAAERERVLKEARDIDFPIGLRGYERAAVDRYVERVTRLITELEMSSSPESAVRHALDEVSEETRDILQRAHQTADEITARSRARADDRLQQAEREAKEMLEAAQHQAQETREAARHDAQELREMTTGEAQNLQEISQREADELRERTMHEMVELRETAARDAHQLRATAQREADEMIGSARRGADEMLESAETRTRDLARSAEAIWRERRRLIDDMSSVGEQLVAMGEVEGKRFPRPTEEPPAGAEHPGEQTSQTISEPAAAPHEVAKR
jgi:cell division septum initiation protein DivIVA